MSAAEEASVDTAPHSFREEEDEGNEDQEAALGRFIWEQDMRERRKTRALMSCVVFILMIIT